MNTATKNPTISLVIVTWNGKKYALECLESLRALSDRLTLEIIVVDNASTDGTPEAIGKGFPEVKLIRNDRNLGFARANNIGIAAATGEILCLLNSDVVVPRGCLEKMVVYLQSHSDVGLLGPKMLSPDGGVGKSVNRLPTVWNYLCFALGFHLLAPKSKLFSGFLMDGYPYDTTEDVEVLTGWFWMVPRVALEDVGRLDERFFIYGEDIDWSHRFLQEGWRVVFFADAAALHYGAASSDQAPLRFYIEMVRANLQYFQKHHGRLASLVFLIATGIHELIRIAGYGFVYCFAPRRRDSAGFKVTRSVSCLKWLTGSSASMALRSGHAA